MNKIKEEHLKTIQEQQTKLNNLLNQIGYVSAQKHGLLHEFGEVNKKVEDFKSVLAVFKSALTSFSRYD